MEGIPVIFSMMQKMKGANELVKKPELYNDSSESFPGTHFINILSLVCVISRKFK